MPGRFFNKHNIPTNISTYLSRTLIIITLAATFLIGGILIIQQTFYFKKLAKQKRLEYIEDQKKYIQEIVRNEITFIERQDAAFEEKIKNKISGNVIQAYNLAEAIYRQFENRRSEEEIQSMILNAVSSLKFDKDYSNIFISGMDGTGVYYSGKPEFSGSDMKNFRDSNGRLVVREEMQLLSTNDEGFLFYDLGTADSVKNPRSMKICFVKKFGHFNWYFGSKQYIDDYYPELKEEIALKISSVRFRHGGYVFVNSIDGTPIVMDGEVYRGKLNMLRDSADSRHKTFLQQVSVAKNNPQGGYFTYQWNKIGENKLIDKYSYVQYYEKYDWIIGAGFYLDEIEQIVASQQKTLLTDQQKSIAIVLIIFLFLLIAEAIIVYHFNRKYKADFERFFNFFYLSNENFNKIETSEFYFEEFKRASIEANNMVDHRKMIEAKLIEEQKRATESDRLKSAFLANMSHEIRTPMNAIVGFSELLDDDSHGPQDKALFIKLIRRNGDILLNLINDIIDISKIEANLLSVRKRKVDLNYFVDELETHFSEIVASQKDKRITFEVKRDIPKSLQINTDETRLRQVLNNLIGNAIKFTSIGSVYISVEYHEDQTVHFKVVDTGIGIPHDQQRKIFERFMQADQGKKNFGGNGLGLAISKNLIELLGGNIHVESEPGKGSCFYFHIPAN